MAVNQLNVEVDKLQNVVEWFGRNFVCGKRPSNVRVLYMFANKIDTPMDQDGNTKYSKFKDETEADIFLGAFENFKFIIQSELVNQDPVKDYETGEVIHVAETWKITCTPSISDTTNGFVAYCPRPYHVIRPFED